MVLQLIIAIGLINVWLFRFNKATEYRGGEATNMKEEFMAYGLPVWLMYFVGAMKVSIALMLIISFWIEELLVYNLIALAVLMIAAVLMHVKVKDPIKKSCKVGPVELRFSCEAIKIFLNYLQKVNM